VVGVLVVAVAIDGKGRLAGDLEIRGLGLPGDAELDEALDELADRAADALARLKPADRMDDDAVEQAVSRAVKKAARQAWDRKPMVETLIVRI
jgi:ribonuclease J